VKRLNDRPASTSTYPMTLVLNLILKLSPEASAGLADAILLLHAGIVAFAVIGQPLFMAGGWRGWMWVRIGWLRLAHLALIGFVVVRSWLGAVCPLTLWEQALRLRAGQAASGQSFIERWLARLIFFNAPAWVFVTTYSVFAVLVLFSWWWIPPRFRRPPAMTAKA
jgi:polyferredoxin